MLRKISTALIMGMILSLFSACGNYNPCDALAERICKECPSVALHWQAACLCMSNGTLKEKGYKCIDPDDIDEDRCHVTLENWNENTCEELN